MRYEMRFIYPDPETGDYDIPDGSIYIEKGKGFEMKVLCFLCPVEEGT